MSDATEWKDRLMGKTLVDGPVAEAESTSTFSRTELPQGTRVVKPGTMMTMDFKPERLNVHVDAASKVTNVRNG
ncbi:hypothetical protein BC828DRAFT_378820 [Blastocladiella britannica]|nr:hypothetical protein BC828DRAFT_378820 [Blastocladiella britannica]